MIFTSVGNVVLEWWGTIWNYN